MLTTFRIRLRTSWLRTKPWGDLPEFPPIMASTELKSSFWTVTRSMTTRNWSVCSKMTTIDSRQREPSWSNNSSCLLCNSLATSVQLTMEIQRCLKVIKSNFSGFRPRTKSCESKWRRLRRRDSTSSESRSRDSSKAWVPEQGVVSLQSNSIRFVRTTVTSR